MFGYRLKCEEEVADVGAWALSCAVPFFYCVHTHFRHDLMLVPTKKNHPSSSSSSVLFPR